VQCDIKLLLTPAERTAVYRANWLAARTTSSGPAFKTMEVALREFGVAAVVVAPGSHPELARYMTAVLGPPTVRQDGAWGWRLNKDWYQHLSWHGNVTWPMPAADPAHHGHKHLQPVT